VRLIAEEEIVLARIARIAKEEKILSANVRRPNLGSPLSDSPPSALAILAILARDISASRFST
jgi:hypothetical protein